MLRRAALRVWNDRGGWACDRCGHLWPLTGDLLREIARAGDREPEPAPASGDLVWVAGVVRDSAVRRLGLPLLRVYAWLVIAGAVVVAASIAWMYLR